MKTYKHEFIEFALAAGVLQFGEFILKSGRNSPYFFNSGLFNTGKALSQLGKFYARAITASKVEFDVLYGPAYKGIPLVSSISIALAEDYNRDVPYAFNRKEIKDHGEGGSIVGAPLKGRILIVDDVISAGTSVFESVDIITSQGATVAGAAIALDREEKGKGDTSAIQEVENKLNINVIHIIGLADMIAYLQNQNDRTVELQAILDYKSKYGITKNA